MKEKGKDAPGTWWWQGWTNLGGDEDFRPGSFSWNFDKKMVFPYILISVPML
jgi:hypothetical protein